MTKLPLAITISRRITPAMLVALNRGDELRVHIRAALHNDVSIDEIQEVFLQCAIYCGVPAANAAFHLAEEVLASPDAWCLMPGA